MHIQFHHFAEYNYFKNKGLYRFVSNAVIQIKTSEIHVKGVRQERDRPNLI
jgi:hypothetical protein